MTTCRRCKLPLTAPLSVARGVGPVCRRRAAVASVFLDDLAAITSKAAEVLPQRRGELTAIADAVATLADLLGVDR